MFSFSLAVTARQVITRVGNCVLIRCMLENDFSFLVFLDVCTVYNYVLHQINKLRYILFLSVICNKVSDILDSIMYKIMQKKKTNSCYFFTYLFRYNLVLMKTDSNLLMNSNKIGTLLQYYYVNIFQIVCIQSIKDGRFHVENRIFANMRKISNFTQN